MPSQILDPIHRRGLTNKDEAYLLLRRSDPFELPGVELDAGVVGLQQGLGDRRAAEHCNLRTILLREIIKIVRCDSPACARHGLQQEAGITGYETAEMLGEEARIKFIPAPARGPYDELHLSSAIEVLHPLRMGWRMRDRQRSQNKPCNQAPPCADGCFFLL